MKQKEQFLYKKILCLSLLICTLNYTESFDDDDFNFSMFEDDSAGDITPFAPEHMTRFPPSDSLSVLTSLDAQNILQTEIYLHTNAPIVQDGFDVPILQIMTIFDTQFRVTPYITSFWKQNYTENSAHIDSYINLKLQDLLEVIDENEFTTIKVPEVLELFTPLKMQSHTAGLMFQGVKVKDDWSFTFAVPILYTLNNFHLTQEERDRISNYPLFTQFNGDITTFARQHLISDRIGIGDTQVTAEYWIKDTYRTFQSIGATLNIPTAFSFKKGLLGTNFNPNTPPYFLNLYSDLLNPYLEDLADSSDTNTALIQNNVEQFSLAALNRLSTMLLERHIGNDYHWAIGVCYRSILYFTDSLYWISKNNFEIQMPSVLQRFFLVEAKPETFEQFDWADNNAQVAEKMALLNTQFNNMFFPTMFYATVFPGILFHSTSCLKKDFGPGRWSPSVGTDSWFHSAEHFLDINHPPIPAGFEINKSKGRRHRAWSSNIWFGIEKSPLPDSSWMCILKAYTSILNSGFADIYGASLIFEKLF